MAELIVVLDVDKADDALALVETCEGCTWFKVGMQLFARCGPGIVTEIQARGKKVMLDLKFHDIPNTVKNASRGAADLGVGMFTLHATGGKRMIEAAREAVEETETRILAVTILTSMSEETLRNEVGIQEAPGVRPEWSSRDDQQRIMTPGDAARAGADFVSIGRPILHHNDPAVAVGLIEKELS